MLSSPWSDLHAGGVLSGLTPAIYFRSSVQFGAVCGNDSSLTSMHLRSRNLPRPSASSPLRLSSLMSSDLATLIAQEIILTTSVPNERGVGAEHQARPYVKGVPLQNLVRLEPGVRRGRSPNRGDHTEARDKSTSQKIRDLDARLDAINIGTNAPVTVDALVRQTDPPFTKRVLRARISSKFKLPTQLGIYEGKTNSHGSLGLVQKPNVSPGNRQKNASHLFTVHQKESESLKDFIKRFNQAVLEVEDPSDKQSRQVYHRRRVGRKPNEGDEERMIIRGKSLIRGELIIGKKQGTRDLTEIPNDLMIGVLALLPADSNLLYRHSTPLLPKYSQKLSTKSSSNGQGRSRLTPRRGTGTQYCEFHRDHGHNTEDCFQLKEQIADLIKRGYLRKYVAARPPPNSPERSVRKNESWAGQVASFSYPLVGFGGNTTHPLGWINLPITLGTEPHQTTVWQDFVVVDCPSPYNAILGRPTLGGIKAITSTYHLKMKFPTLTGIGEVKGDQKVARQCFISAIKVGTSVQSAQ
ncbi:hypothetical protein Acr_03g0010380 [Actinidia rufa]|uniref:Uncharacterized protein n=1 Tax=Actinidia rufa TaxID=165716 RepID=A0A7J0ECN3_9ERIC|nr:hypothetical protein Acr_03g0010380 [Actinidia rufa]